MKYTVYTQSGIELAFIKSEKGVYRIRSFFRPMSTDVVKYCKWSEMESSDKRIFNNVLYRTSQNIPEKQYNLAKMWFKYF